MEPPSCGDLFAEGGGYSQESSAQFEGEQGERTGRLIRASLATTMVATQKWARLHWEPLRP